MYTCNIYVYKAHHTTYNIIHVLYIHVLVYTASQAAMYVAMQIFTRLKVGQEIRRQLIQFRF